MNKFAWILTPLPCAVLFCLANALKPAVVDDQAYLWFIPPILENPLQPFGPPPDGFKLIWYDRGQASFTLLVPMVVPYWLALGAQLFGDNLIGLKLWLFPFCWLLTGSLAALLRRFAPGYERLLLGMIILSPALLPSLNVMVDVPALALGLTAIAVFLRSLDGSTPRWGLIIVAGLLGGLAAQTKYTGIAAVLTIVWLALLHRRWGAGLVAVLVAAALFVAWEAHLANVYGRSHFLMHLQHRRVPPVEAAGPERIIAEIGRTIAFKAGLAVSIAGILGGLTVAVSALLLVGLRCPRWLVWAVLGMSLAGFLLMAVVPNSWAVFIVNPELARDEISISTIVAGAWATLFVGTLLAAAVVLAVDGWRQGSGRNPSLLLLGWLAIEIAGCFLLSPFAATRRVMGIVVVATLIGGRLLERSKDASSTSPRQMLDRERRWLVNAIAAIGVGLGMLFAWTDYLDARAEQIAVRDSIAWIQQLADGDRPIWFTGHWGFHYYARAAGLRAVYPTESDLEEGDWLIYPHTLLRPYGQLVRLEPEWAEKVADLEWGDRWPLRTIPDFYDGYQPIYHHEGPRMRVTIFRVKKKFRAQPV